MSQFVVSARKYRPETFDTVVGQEAVTSTLMNAIRTKHLASAFLFTGPRGVGKTTCARILARTINCEKLNEDLSTCGECAPCKTFLEGHSLSIFELDAASNNSVDDIRNLILQVSIAPQVGEKKVYIIDEVHMLSQAAFNAFLKTLEEPPPYAIFILATTEKHKILPTILSRCQVFDFRRIQIADITKHLASIAKKEGIEAEPRALHVIAQKADGGLRDALSIFDQLVSYAGNRITYQDVVKNLNVLDHEHYFSLIDDIVKGDVPAALVEYNTILANGFDGHLFVTGLARHFRDLLVSQDLVKRYGEQAQNTPREVLIRGLERLAQCDAQYKVSKEPRMLVELTLMQLCRLSTPTASEPTAPAEKKSPDVSAAPPPKPAAPVPTSVVAEPKPESGNKPATNGDGYAPKRRLVRDHISINPSAPSNEPAATVAVAVDTDEGPDLSLVSGTINEALLNRAWSNYASSKKGEGKLSLFATLTFKPLTIRDGRIVIVTIANAVQEKDLREEKPFLTTYMRRETGFAALSIESFLDDSLAVKRPTTPIEKFRHLAEKNPALLKLREELDLDLG
jgi:DNA polymerase-3 subunit gamma/tau